VEGKGGRVLNVFVLKVCHQLELHGGIRPLPLHLASVRGFAQNNGNRGRDSLWAGRKHGRQAAQLEQWVFRLGNHPECSIHFAVLQQELQPWEATEAAIRAQLVGRPMPKCGPGPGGRMRIQLAEMLRRRLGFPRDIARPYGWHFCRCHHRITIAIFQPILFVAFSMVSGANSTWPALAICIG